MRKALFIHRNLPTQKEFISPPWKDRKNILGNLTGVLLPNQNKVVVCPVDRRTVYYPALDVAHGSNDPEGYDIVVNATPLGTQARRSAAARRRAAESAQASSARSCSSKAEIAFRRPPKARGCKTTDRPRHAVRDIPR